MKVKLLALSMVLFAGGCTTIQHADQVVIMDHNAQRATSANSVPARMVAPNPLVNQVVFPGYLPVQPVFYQPSYPVSESYPVSSAPAYQYSGYGLYDVTLHRH